MTSDAGAEQERFTQWASSCNCILIDIASKKLYLYQDEQTAKAETWLAENQYQLIEWNRREYPNAIIHPMNKNVVFFEQTMDMLAFLAANIDYVPITVVNAIIG